MGLMHGTTATRKTAVCAAECSTTATRKTAVCAAECSSNLRKLAPIMCKMSKRMRDRRNTHRSDDHTTTRRTRVSPAAQIAFRLITREFEPSKVRPEQSDRRRSHGPGRLVCVLILRLNSSCSRSIAFVVRTLRHWLGGRRVKLKSRSPASSKLTSRRSPVGHSLAARAGQSELAARMLRLAAQDERDPVRLRVGTLTSTAALD
jgi:hypothetical protein